MNGGGLTLDALVGVHLVVFRFEFNPADAADPRPRRPMTTASRCTSTSRVQSKGILQRHRIAVDASDLFISHHGGLANFTFSGGGHCPGKFDEVRWGDTFADVTPFQGANGNPGNTACNVNPPTTVPVPGTLSLLALGVVGLTLARRRKA